MFYDNLKEICEQKNIKMTPVLKACGVATGAISNWKKGIYPNSEIVLKIATHLNVPTDYLLKGEKSSKLTPEDEKILKAYKLSNETEKRILDGIISDILNRVENKGKEQGYTA